MAQINTSAAYPWIAPPSNDINGPNITAFYSQFRHSFPTDIKYRTPTQKPVVTESSTSSPLSSNSALSSSPNGSPIATWRGTTYLTQVSDPEGVAKDTASAPADQSEEDARFERMCADYLNMLSQEQDSDDKGLADGHVNPFAIDAAAHCVDALDARPCSPLEEDFLTSPLDSPFEDLLVTPAVDFAAGVLTQSPVVAEGDLAADEHLKDVDNDLGHLKDVNIVPTTLDTPPIPSLDGLYTMPSPTSSPTSLPTSYNFRRREPTGTRPGLTPDSLIAIDAPTKVRHYSGPSCTSKKDVPKFFERRKRNRGVTFASDDGSSKRARLSQVDAEQIDAKRRQNTEAARRSRKRKLEYTRNLETHLDQMQLDRDSWKARAVVAEALLRGCGITVPLPDAYNVPV